ncbi:hypothetical protein PENTCL1PPCAC_9517, partial [Pristionchus entomophagus]
MENGQARGKQITGPMLLGIIILPVCILLALCWSTTSPEIPDRPLEELIIDQDIPFFSEHDMHIIHTESKEAVRDKWPRVHEKVKTVQGKESALGEEATEFYHEVLQWRYEMSQAKGSYHVVLVEFRNKVLGFSDKFAGLSDQAKNELEKQFPITASVFKNE